MEKLGHCHPNTSVVQFLQLLTASGMTGVIGPPAQRLVTKGNEREGELNHQQNTVELNAKANLQTQKIVTRCPAVSFCTQPDCFTIYFFRWLIEANLRY